MLHLVDCDPDFQTRTMVAAASAAAGLSIHTVGRGGTWRDCLSAARYLKRHPEPVHAWGRKSLIAAALAACDPIIFTAPPEMSRKFAHRLHWLSKRRNLAVICTTAALRAELCQIGLAPDRCRLIPPGISADANHQHNIRRELGISPNDFVILAPGESTRAAAHDLALWSTAIVHELDPSWKLLVWGRGPLAGQVRRFGAKLNRPELLVIGDRFEFQDLLGASDAALVTAAPSAATLPVALCMTAGLPTVFATHTRMPMRLAQELIALRADPGARAALSQSLKMEAKTRFNPRRFLDLHNTLYAELGIPLSSLTHPDSSLPAHALR